MPDKKRINPELAQPWLIHPDWLGAYATDIESLSVKDGEPYDESNFVSIRGGVAVVDIRGALVRYAGYGWWSSSRLSIETLAKTFQSAVDDPAVKAILLNIDSPGGQVNGIHEMGELIYAARVAKPVWAYSGGMAASAAYWLGTAAERLVIDATASVGSIGVVALMVDWSKFDERVGIQEVEIVSSQSPNKRPDVKTEEGRTQIRKELDALADVFIDRVARNRGVTVETVLSDFGQGGILVGYGAVTAGMADEIGSFEGVMADLQSKVQNNHHIGGFSMSEQEQPVTVTREYLDAEHKALVESIKDEGFQAGVEWERARIKALEAFGAAGHEALIEKCKFEEPVSAEQAAVMVLTAERQARETAAANLAADAAEIPDIPANPPTDQGDQSWLSAAVAGMNASRG